MKRISAAAALGVAALWAGAAFAEPAAQVAIHVDENDLQRLNMVLNNAMNIDAYYDERGEEAEIAIVAYGPGLHMLREDTSPVKDRVEMMAFEHPNITFRGCQNTADAMAEKEGTAPEMIDGVAMVESGAQHLIELQQQGWQYLRP
jgi:intracellular sulfur oxidation DsrE/DsrF family protein